MWPSVRRGEEENIFPFQEDADAMFNSALIYELAVLKQYAEPLLFGIRPEEPEYVEAMLEREKLTTILTCLPPVHDKLLHMARFMLTVHRTTYVTRRPPPAACT